MFDVPQLSVVIPTHNRCEETLNAIKSIYNQDTAKSFEIIVVDDGSTHDCSSFIKKCFSKVRVITLSMNRGPAVARNIGIKEAKGKIIVGLDSDVTFASPFLIDTIFSIFERQPNIAGLAFRILLSDKYTDDYGRWWHPRSIKEDAGKPFYTDYFSGTGYAFRREVFDKAGYFPEDLFMHGEENDIVLRILDAGFEILYCPDIVVLHKVSQQSRNTLISCYYKRRNQIWIVTKYYPVLKGMAFIIPRLAKTFFECLLKGGLLIYCRALYDALRGLPHILKERKPLKRETWENIRLIRHGRCRFHKP
jgi:GT2 family glycosyltransferase